MTLTNSNYEIEVLYLDFMMYLMNLSNSIMNVV